MKIKSDVLDQINIPTVRNRIAMAYGIGEQAVAVWCRKNRANGPLTKAQTLQVIRAETGLDNEDILESEEKVVSVQKRKRAGVQK